MALNSSGPISLGGSTVGQSINLELGVSATATASINSTPFRNLAGVASGAISLSNFYGKSSVTYYLMSFEPSSPNSTLWDFGWYGLGTAGSDYYWVANPITGSNSQTVMKMPQSGASLTWIRGNQYTPTDNTGVNSSPMSMGVNASGNGFILGRCPTSSSNLYQGYTTTWFDSAGTMTRGSVITVYSFNNTTNYQNGIYSNVTPAFVDSSGNVFFVWRGNYFEPGDLQSTAVWLAKYNSSKSLVFNFCMGSTSGGAYGYHNPSGMPLVQSGGTITVCGYFGNAASSDGFLTAMNVSAAGNSVNWQYNYTPTGTWSVPSGSGGPFTAIDSSNNHYFTAQSNYTALSGNTGTQIYKLDSSGAVSWCTGLAINATSRSLIPYAITVDSSLNVYVMCRYGQGYPSGSTVLAKLNSSGVLQWCMQFGNNTYGMNPIGICVNSNGSLGLAINNKWSGNNNFAILLNYPVDGSKTGTFTAGNSTVTISALTILSPSVSVTRTTRTIGTGGNGYRTYSVNSSAGTPTASLFSSVI